MLLAAIALASLHLSAVRTAKLPPDFKRCKLSSPQINDCLKDAIQHAVGRLRGGYRPLGIAPIDPLYIPSVTIGKGGGAVDVVQRYKDFVTRGFGDAKILSVDARFDEKYLKFSITVPKWSLEAEYDFDGRILVVPIKGAGPCRMSAEDVRSNHTVTFADAATRFEVTGYVMALEPLDRVAMRFDNLFDGDRALGDATNRVLNENSAEIYEEVKDGYAATYAAAFRSAAEKVFGQVALEDIFVYE